MLYPARHTVFVVFSILIHVAFAILFARVTLSFQPPDVKELSLAILTREGGPADIVQSQAAWPMPRRREPGFSAGNILESFEGDSKEWTLYGMPESHFFSPKETLVPKIEIAELAAEAYAGPPEEFYSHLSAESKTTPMNDFALGPAVPELFENDR